MSKSLKNNRVLDLRWDSTPTLPPPKQANSETEHREVRGAAAYAFARRMGQKRPADGWIRDGGP